MEIALIYFAVLAVAFFLLLVRPQRRRAQAHREFVAGLEVGDDVMTTGGILGTIRSLDDEIVELEVSPGTVIRVARLAIAQPVTPERMLPDAGTDAGSGSDGAKPDADGADGEARR
ncbi:MAG TPA: preprotein translocase subunit YajC [Acidimicrobiia bacterium]|nr:preprotein translocase subunit YajC [Acidimicrobiia bacterium]